MEFDLKHIQDAVIVKEYCRKTGVLKVCAFTDEIIFAGDDSLACHEQCAGFNNDFEHVKSYALERL